MKQQIINAKGKSLGRIASEIAVLLQGKHTPAYEARLESDVKVVVENIGEMIVTGKKVKQKKYYKHTGPIGHLKETKFEEKMEKKPDWVLKRAVRLMLPKNRLQAKRMKRLIIK